MIDVKLVYRKNSKYGQLRKLKLYADDTHLADIKPKEEISIKIPKDAKYFYGKMDWGKTDVMEINDIIDGDALEIVANLTSNPLRWLGLQSIPISIRKI